MYCSKCGKEIKEGNTFCTNCGEPIISETKKIENKKEIKIKLTSIIVFLVLVVLAFLIIVFIISKGSNKEILDKDNNIEKSNNAEVLEEYKYITQDSNVSPTKKEFIGVFSTELTQGLEQGISNDVNTQIKYYDSSCPNIKTYAQETYFENKITGKKDKAIEQQYYYNATNNNIIGHRYYTISLPYLIQGLNANNMTLDEFETTHTNATINIFRNLHNDRSEQEIEKAKKYIEYWTNQMTDNGIIQDEITINGEVYTYRVLGDVLKILRTFNNNEEMELLYLAFDINSNPKEVIENWFNAVTVINDNVSYDTTENFIDEIKSKYPNESEEICTNGAEYWLLDTAGKKIYFYDLESFEKALGNTSINETSKNTTNNNTNNQNSNKTQNENELEPYTRHLIAFEEGFAIENYTETLDNWGIKYKVNKVQDLNFDDNVVTKIEPNNCYIDKNTIVTFSVSDNTYDMSVVVDTQYLVGLANITGKYSGDKIQLTLKINGQIIFNGTTDVLGMVHSLSLGNISGKSTGTYNVEATVDGVTITKKINYNIRCNSYTQRFEIYAGGDIGGG